MHYRDTRTGRFVSAATWKRSRSHGGTRYKRVSPRKARRRTPQPKHMAPAAPPGLQRETGAIPLKFLEAADEFFESGYESEEEDEYP